MRDRMEKENSTGWMKEWIKEARERGKDGCNERKITEWRDGVKMEDLRQEEKNGGKVG